MRTRPFILKEAKRNKRLLTNMSLQDQYRQYARYSRNYLSESQLRGRSYRDVGLMMQLSESLERHPRELINEGIWSAIKSFFGAAAKDPSVSNEEIEEYLANAESVKDAYKRAKGDGATWWQSIKAGHAALGSMFQQGTQVWSKKEGAKLQIKARKEFEKLKQNVESQLGGKAIDDLKKALSKERLGDPQRGGFPNNSKPEDFRFMLTGCRTLAEIQENGSNFGGIMGAMLGIKDGCQAAIDSNMLSVDEGNKIVKKLVAMLQYYQGVMKDAYQSLENRSRGGRDILGPSLVAQLYGNDYYLNQVIAINEDATFPAKIDPSEIGKVVGKEDLSEEDAEKALTFLTTGKGEEEALEILTPQQLKKMKSAQGILRPIIMSIVGAVLAAIGFGMGGSILPGGDEAVGAITDKIMGEGNVVLQPIEKMVPEVTEFMVQKGDGLTHVFKRYALEHGQKWEGTTDQMLELWNNHQDMVKGMIDEGNLSADGAAQFGEALKKHAGEKLGSWLTKSGGYPWDLNWTGVVIKATKMLLKAGVKKWIMGVAGTSLGISASPFILAGVGVSVLTAGVAIAALRKFAKSRRKTLDAMIDLLNKPLMASPTAVKQGEHMEKIGLEPPVIEPDQKADPTDGFDKSLELVYRAMDKKGYKRDDAEQIMDVLFDPEDPFPDARMKLTNDSTDQEMIMAHKMLRNIGIGSLLTEEALPYEEFQKFMKGGAEKAGVPVPSDEQTAYAAVAFNLANGIGDIVDLPPEAEDAEMSAELKKMADKIGQLEDQLADATEVKKKWMRKLVDEKKITEDQANQIKKMAGDNASLEKMVIALQELAHKDGLKMREMDEAMGLLENEMAAQQQEWSEKETELKDNIDNLARQLEEMTKQGKKNNQALDTIDEAMGDFIEQNLKGKITLDDFMADPANAINKMKELLDSDAEEKLAIALVEKTDDLTQQIAELEGKAAKLNSVGSLYVLIRNWVEKVKGGPVDPFKMRKNLKNWPKNWDEVKKSGNGQKFRQAVKDLNDDQEFVDAYGRKIKMESARTQNSQDLINERWLRLAGLL